MVRVCTAVLCVVIAILALPWLTNPHYRKKHWILLLLGTSGAVSALSLSDYSAAYLSEALLAKTRMVSYIALLSAITLYPFAITEKWLRQAVLAIIGLGFSLSALIIASPQPLFGSIVFSHWLSLSLSYPLVAMTPLFIEKKVRQQFLLFCALGFYFIIGLHDVAIMRNQIYGTPLVDLAGALILLVIFFRENVLWKRTIIKNQINKVRYELALQVSHDIKSPLATIKVAENLLRENTQKNILGAIELLELGRTRLERISDRLCSEYQRAPGSTNVNEIAETLIREFSQQTDFKTIDFSIAKDKMPSFTHLPYEKVEHCLANVIKNSCEAVLNNRKRQKMVNVTLATIPNRNEIQVTVHDNGPGFSKDALQSLWSGIPTTSKQRGHGIGLQIVDKTMKKLGGSVALANKQSAGAKITLNFPRN